MSIKYLSLKTVSVSLVLFIGIVAVVLVGASGEISPGELTITRLDVLEARIRFFWAKESKLPKSLSELPQFSNRDNSTKDGWGKDIAYKGEGTKVTLATVGDGARHIVRSFDVGKDGNQ